MASDHALSSDLSRSNRKGDNQNSPEVKVTITTTEAPAADTTIVRSAAVLHGEVFKTDPVLNFMLCDFPTFERHAYMPTYLSALMRAGSLNSGVFDEAVAEDPASSVPFAIKGNTSPVSPVADGGSPLLCSAVWMPPNKHIDNWRTYYSSGLISVMWHVGLRGIMRALGDYNNRAIAAKKKALASPDGKGNVDYWYLFFCSTDAKARGKGVGTQVIQRMQNKLREEASNQITDGEDGKRVGTPIWLEATTDASRRLYARLGFQEIDTWVLGQGVADESGERRNGGNGVRVWGMVWWPV